MSNNRLEAYQIEILDFKRNGKKHSSDAVISDTKGDYLCQRCGWEGLL